MIRRSAAVVVAFLAGCRRHHPRSAPGTRPGPTAGHRPPACTATVHVNVTPTLGQVRPEPEPMAAGPVQSHPTYVEFERSLQRVRAVVELGPERVDELEAQLRTIPPDPVVSPASWPCHRLGHFDGPDGRCVYCTLPDPG